LQFGGNTLWDVTSGASLSAGTGVTVGQGGIGSLLINGGAVFLSDDFAENTDERSSPAALGGSPVTIHMIMDDVDTLYNRAIAAGATASMPLADMFWGSRYGQLVDPFGHHWSFGTPQKPLTWSSGGITSSLAGRHIGYGTTPGSTRSRPSKNRSICAFVRSSRGTTELL